LFDFKALFLFSFLLNHSIKATIIEKNQLGILIVSERNKMMRDVFHINKNSVFMLFALVFTVSLQISCSNTSRFLATYTPEESNISIAVELVSTHAFLAEYDRFAVLLENGREVRRAKLFPDSGGYASSNLYRCGANKYLLKGYFDAWILDFDTKTLTEGKCETSKLEYIGIFEGGGSKPWKYYSSEQRRETILEAKGG